MAIHAQERRVLNVPWADNVDDCLRVAARGDLDIIRHQVESGIAQLWECTSDEHHAYIVTRVEPGPEIVIVAGEGSGFMEFVPDFIAVAKRSGATIRAHVVRKGMIRLFERVGLSLNEYVLRG